MLAHGVPTVEVIEIDEFQSSSVEASSAASTSAISSRKRRRQNSKPYTSIGANTSCELVDLSSSEETAPGQAVISNPYKSENSSRAHNVASFRPNYEDVIDLSDYVPIHAAASSRRIRNVTNEVELIETQDGIINLVDDEALYVSTVTNKKWNANEDAPIINDFYPVEVEEGDRKMNAIERSMSNSYIPPPTLNILDRILEVFPDCDLQCAQQLCSKHGIDATAYATEGTAAIVASILEEMSEVGYTKVPKPAAKAESASAAFHSYDFASTSWEPPLLYKQQVYGLLMNNFPFLSAYGVRLLLSMHKSHYAPSHKAVCDALIEASSNDPLVRLSTFAVGFNLGRPWLLTRQQQNALETLLQQNTTPVTVKQCRRTKVAVPVAICSVLQQEIHYVEERQRRFHEEHRIIVERERAHKVAVSNGTTIECGCCYGDFALEEMCQCQDGHLFCTECLQRYAQEQLFGQQKTELLCLATTDECTAVFDRTQLLRALPVKVMEKYDEASFLANLEKANIEGLCKCPKCDFSAILPETENIFHCPNVQCRFESCKFCGEESHIPLKCSEVEKKSDTDARKTVEEAMANARIRECPTCHKRFFKEEGCNKMTCACGTKICYVCRAKIKDYTHFCQQPHCTHKTANCNKCPLYSNSVEEDKDAVRRAALRAAGNVTSIVTTGSEISKVNVEKLIQSVSI